MDTKKILATWQKRLGLSDWEIDITLESAIMTNNGQACTKIYATSQKAVMVVMQESDRQASDPNDNDIELDIIHELIHIRLWAIDPEAEGILHTCREQAVEWIAKALTSLDRRE